MNSYQIHRVPRGKRVMFYPTINGKRVSKTLFARKWEARRTLQNWIDHYGHEKLAAMTGKD